MKCEENERKGMKERRRRKEEKKMKRKRMGIWKDKKI